MLTVNMTATGIESQIAEALFQRLTALVLNPALPIAMPNVAFPKAGDDKPDLYLRASLLRAPTRTVGIAAWDEHTGILQVDVVYGLQNGELKPLQVADSVADWFKRGTRLVNGLVQVDVYESPSIASAVPDGTYSAIPVSVRYRVFTK